MCWEPCKYTVKESVVISNDWLLRHVVPAIAGIFDQQTALVLALPLTWAVFDEEQTDAVCHQICSK
eukprot:5258875-Ditylum_brightwellii.AAC.1